MALHIRPILSAMLRNKTGAVLMALQIAFTFAVVVNSSFIVTTRVEKMTRPTGLDEPNLFALGVQGFGEDFDGHGMVQRDLDHIRSMPGVVDASPSNQIPLSGGGWGTGLRTELDRETEQRASGNVYESTPDTINTLGVELIAGRNFTPEDVIWRLPADDRETASTIVTAAMAEALFPDIEPEDAVGRTVYWGNEGQMTIVGIIAQMHGAWVSWDSLENSILVPSVGEGPNFRYLIRTEPGQRDRVMREVEQALAELDRSRVVGTPRSLEEYKSGSYEGDRAMAIVMAVVMLLLIIITSLGIVGLAFFTVTQRFKQIGTRRALGARKVDIVKYFLAENWLVTSIGLALGAMLTVGVNIALVHAWDLPKLNWTYLPAGLVFIWALGQIASYLPAQRAARISPAVATRNV